MTSNDTSSLLALGSCLLVLAFAAGMVVFVLSQAAKGRSRRRGRSPGGETGVPTPTRLPGEEPLWTGSQTEVPDCREGESIRAVELPYIRRPLLLTQAERDFFAVLRVAAPEGWYVFPQVRLANLVALKKGTRNWKPHFSRVAQKCVDFVLCDDVQIGPRLVVELDDSSHDRPDRQARDQFVDAALRAAGLPILHVRWQRHYDRDELSRQIAAAAGIKALPSQLGQEPAGAPAREPALPRATNALAPVPAMPPMASAIVPPPAARSSLPAAPQRWACRSCNAEVSATAKFCTACGARLEL